MDGYQGQFPVDVSQSEFAHFGPAEWAIYFISSYGQIDGDHHKAWVLDQVSRVLHGTPVVIEEARWVNTQHPDGYTEYRVTTGEPSAEYLAWVEGMRFDAEEGEEYGYSEGIAP